MELCPNCFKTIPQKYPFCPLCGFPTLDIGLKKCNNGHIIYETCRTCPICSQVGNLGKSLINTDLELNAHSHTEVINRHGQNFQDPKTIPFDKTVLETFSPITDATVVEDIRKPGTGIPPIDKTVLETNADKTILDMENESEDAPLVPLPDFYAWLVFLDEEGKPVHDVRISHDRIVIGKGADADIHLKDDFASKLHALIYLEEGKKFVIVDLGSTNHTFLNERRAMKEDLNSGDIIRIGRQRMTFIFVRRTFA